MKLPQFTIQDLLIATALVGAFICAYVGLVATAGQSVDEVPLSMRKCVFFSLATLTANGVIIACKLKRRRPWWLGAGIGLLSAFLLFFAAFTAFNHHFGQARSAPPLVVSPITSPMNALPEEGDLMQPVDERYACIPAAQFRAESSWDEMTDSKGRAWRYRLLPQDYNEQGSLESSGVTYFLPAASLEALRRSLSNLTDEE